MTTPTAVYKMLISQTELRKWWAPRVIMSKNIVSQEEGRDVLMKLLQTEKNHMVRYNWKPLDWSDEVPPTVISVEITDMGVSRRKTGEGIQLEILHDGWTDQDERDRQERIWKMAIGSLKAELRGKLAKPWWESENVRSKLQQVKLPALKQFAEKIEKENRGKSDKKVASQVVWQLCQGLDKQGKWLLKESGNEFELHYQQHRIFGVNKNGNLSLGWRELEEALGGDLTMYSDRLSMEQSMDLHVGKNQERIPAHQLNPELWIQWCIDLIQSVRERCA